MKIVLDRDDRAEVAVDLVVAVREDQVVLVGPVVLEALEEEEVLVVMDPVAQVGLVRHLSLIFRKCGKVAFAMARRLGGRLCRRVLGTITSLAKPESGLTLLGQLSH